MTTTSNNDHDVDIGPCNSGPDGNRIAAQSFASVFARAYLEASDEVQHVIHEMSRICADESVDGDTRASALDTLTEALFPQTHKDELGIDFSALKVLSQDGTDIAAIERGKRAEEANFASRLARLMEKHDLNQQQLADKVGVGQPAISMMLNRDCRPQRRTIKRIADAFEIDPAELWPGYSE